MGPGEENSKHFFTLFARPNWLGLEGANSGLVDRTYLFRAVLRSPNLVDAIGAVESNIKLRKMAWGLVHRSYLRLELPGFQQMKSLLMIDYMLFPRGHNRDAAVEQLRLYGARNALSGNYLGSEELRFIGVSDEVWPVLVQQGHTVRVTPWFKPKPHTEE